MPSPRLLILAFCSALTIHAAAQSTLRTMTGPQGGNIVYGTVDGANTAPAAMGTVLKLLHRQYNDRPQVGRVFRVRGTESDAVFFTVTNRTQTPTPKAGLLLISSVPGHVEAAVLSDDASHFATSINPMMQKLFQTWTPGGKPLQASTSGRTPNTQTSTPVARLRPYTLPDRSASVMLAEGWQVNPQSSNGLILANGPRGEILALGFSYLAENSNDPHAAQMRNLARSQTGRNTIYARTLFAPYGADLGRTFTELNGQSIRVGGPAVPPVQIEQTQPVRTSGNSRCAILSGTSPATQRQQALQFEGSFCQTQPDSVGSFKNIANLAFVPAAQAATEQATLRAMLSSFQINQAVVNAQDNAAAAPAIEAIRQIGRDVNARIAVADQENAERRSSFEQHNDAMDRSGQGFSNYMLDKSVILDNQNNAHGTTWNSTAEALVKSDPKRYEYVDTPGYWRGIDY